MNRVLASFYSLICRSGIKRAKFYKKHRCFYDIGENVMIQTWKLPLYSKLIKLGNNVRIASNVLFCTHDAIHNMLNNLQDGNEYKEMAGCIEIGNNVFIGANSIIMYNTKIGNNIVVASGSVITKDLEDNSIYAGVPAKKIGTFDNFKNKRKIYSDDIIKNNITDIDCEFYWKEFNNTRQ